jgi:hypothetical protein
MKTISVAVSEADYEAFRDGAQAQGRSIAQLIREAMALYREQRLESRSRMLDVPVLVGHRPVIDVLPSREELYDDIYRAERSDRAQLQVQTVNEPGEGYGDDQP